MTIMDFHGGYAGALALALVLVASAHAGAAGLRAGQWQTVETPEINGVAGPPQQGARCLTPSPISIRRSVRSNPLAGLLNQDSRNSVYTPGCRNFIARTAVK